MSPSLARDLMEPHVICVDASAPLLDVHRLFVEEEIHRAPVLAQNQSVAGVITASDLMRAVEEERDTARVQTNDFRDLLPYSVPDWASDAEDFQDRLGELRAEDAMTAEVLSVAPETPAPEIARLLREHRVHRVFVVEDGQLRGVVTAFDLLRLLEPAEG